jgi:predicted amidophosphoribosyltransferase
VRGVDQAWERTCAGCGEPFAPLARGERLCPECRPAADDTEPELVELLERDPSERLRGLREAGR